MSEGKKTTGPELIARNVVMKAIRHARYPVDKLGVPREPYRTAIEDAVAAQVGAYEQAGMLDQLATGGATAEAKVASTSNQGASITFDTSRSDGALDYLHAGGLAPEAEAILSLAGLLGGKPGVWR